MRIDVRPRVVLSRCLEMEACRYNGRGIRSTVVRMLEPHVEYVPVCPEVEIGLGVPRDPIRVERGRSPEGASLESEHGELRLVQPSTDRDLTARMLGFGRSFADATEAVDGLLLKSRSPSCGIRDVKVYAGEAPVTDRGTGLFAAVLRDRYPAVTMEDEGRLTNAEIRHHWLTRVYVSARLRHAAAEGPRGLMAFHRRYKLLLLAYSPEGQRALGRLVAEAASTEDFDRLVAAYREGLATAMGEPASRAAHVNAIQHAQGSLEGRLSGPEKRRLLSLQTEYRAGGVPLQALLAVLSGWSQRLDEPYLREQLYFRPYPRELLVPADSGRGRLGA